MRFLGISALAAACLAPLRARAEVTIETPASALAERCGDVNGRLGARVRRLVSAAEWASSQTATVTLTARGDGTGFDVLVRIGDEALLRTIPAEEGCNVLLSAIAVVVAVAITEPESLAPIDEVIPPPVSEPPPPPAEDVAETAPEVEPAVEEAPPEEAPQEEEPAAALPPPRAPRGAIGISVEGVTELADLALPGASLVGYGPLGPLRWDVALSFRATRAQSIAPGWEARARFLAASARLGACLPFARRRAVFFGCLAAELGLVHGAAPLAKSPENGVGYTLAAEAEARVSVPREGRVHATFFVGVAAYPLRAAFEVLNEGRVYTTPVAAATLGARAEWSFP